MIPLSEKLRPTKIDEIVGQKKLLQDSPVLGDFMAGKYLSSFIMWGPPGCGKTTIAKIVLQNCKLSWKQFSAVHSSITQIKAFMLEAEKLFKLNGQATVFFVDEIHRFNKAQQDAFLPYIESGAIILIGATTENPSFEVISALLSRCHLFVLESLSEDEIFEITCKVDLDGKNIEEEVLRYLAKISEGDARVALRDMELLLNSNEKQIDFKKAKKILQSKAAFYDKNGEEHYNLISAFHKSVRGSDPQASLYWLARMLEGGEDPKFIARRMIRIASEDIGLADPQALVQAVSAKQALDCVGMPEASLCLAQAVIYLATAPKSNKLEVAWIEAKADANATKEKKVPFHIRNAPTKLMKDLGYNDGYKYAHDFPNAYTYQRYFPDEMKEKQYYTPSKFGFESEIKKRLDWWENLKKKETKKNEN